MIEHLLAPLVPEKFLLRPAYRRGHIRVINPLPGTRVMGLHIPEMKKTAITSGNSVSGRRSRPHLQVRGSSGQKPALRRIHNLGTDPQQTENLQGRTYRPFQEVHTPHRQLGRMRLASCADARWPARYRNMGIHKTVPQLKQGVRSALRSHPVHGQGHEGRISRRDDGHNAGHRPGPHSLGLRTGQTGRQGRGSLLRDRCREGRRSMYALPWHGCLPPLLPAGRRPPAHSSRPPAFRTMSSNCTSEKPANRSVPGTFPRFNRVNCNTRSCPPAS